MPEGSDKQVNLIALQRGRRVQDAFTYFHELLLACPCIVSPVVDTERTLVSDRAQKVICWKEYREQLLSS